MYVYTYIFISMGLGFRRGPCDWSLKKGSIGKRYIYVYIYIHISEYIGRSYGVQGLGGY